MEIIPAIDIRGGRCVRLTQGDYDQETVFAEDPAAMAQRWQELGAQRLHVIDLDGARQGRPVNTATIQSILTSVTVPVQLGGGLRDLESMQRYLNLGVDRLVLGTAALKDRALLQEALAFFGPRIVVAVDAKAGFAVSEGWQEASSLPATRLVQELAALGVARFIYTDVLADGTLSGPNVAAIEALLSRVSSSESRVSLLYSGGVACLDDLIRLSRLDLEGVIVGKALYTGAIDLTQALSTLT